MERRSTSDCTPADPSLARCVSDLRAVWVRDRWPNKGAHAIVSCQVQTIQPHGIRGSRQISARAPHVRYRAVRVDPLSMASHLSESRYRLVQRVLIAARSACTSSCGHCPQPSSFTCPLATVRRYQRPPAQNAGSRPLWLCWLVFRHAVALCSCRSQT